VLTLSQRYFSANALKKKEFVPSLEGEALEAPVEIFRGKSKINDGRNPKKPFPPFLWDSARY
jgi:hypothetical protein